jgi:hypothetical protein
MGVDPCPSVRNVEDCSASGLRPLLELPSTVCRKLLWRIAAAACI